MIMELAKCSNDCKIHRKTQAIEDMTPVTFGEGVPPLRPLLPPNLRHSLAKLTSKGTIWLSQLTEKELELLTIEREISFRGGKVLIAERAEEVVLPSGRRVVRSRRNFAL